MATVNINNLPYEVDEEVAEQFSKFIRRANAKDEQIKALEAEVKTLRNSLSTEIIHHCDELECINNNLSIKER
jgi:hypothetical protein